MTVADGASASIRSLKFAGGSHLVNNGTVEVRRSNGGGQGTFTNNGRVVLVDDQGQRPELAGNGWRFINTTNGVLETGAAVSANVGAFLNGGTVLVLGGARLSTVSFQQEATGILQLELAAGHATLSVREEATHAGTFRYSLTAGAEAVTGSLWPVLTYGSRRGEFATVMGEPPGTLLYGQSTELRVN